MRVSILLCSLFIVHTLAASIVPIANAVPTWASSRDICEQTRTCDNCKTSQYCKYIRTQSYCCETPPAGIKPIQDNPIPVWANQQVTTIK
jgi:hypothetical protein